MNFVGVLPRMRAVALILALVPGGAAPSPPFTLAETLSSTGVDSILAAAAEAETRALPPPPPLSGVPPPPPPRLRRPAFIERSVKTYATLFKRPRSAEGGWEQGRAISVDAPLAQAWPTERVAPRAEHNNADYKCLVPRSELAFVDADFPGHDLIDIGDFPQLMGQLLGEGHTEGDLVARCCALCSAEPRCNAWALRQATIFGASCSLKARPTKRIVPARRPYSGTIAGFAMSKDECGCTNRGIGERCWSAEPLGCFRDKVNHAVGSVAGLAHSPRHCAQLCAERFPTIWTSGVVALGSRTMCFCSTEAHDYSRYGRVAFSARRRPSESGAAAASPSSCTMKCRGSEEMCGNTLAISVYRSVLSDAADCAMERVAGVASPREKTRATGGGGPLDPAAASPASSGSSASSSRQYDGYTQVAGARIVGNDIVCADSSVPGRCYLHVASEAAAAERCSHEVECAAFVVVVATGSTDRVRVLLKSKGASLAMHTESHRTFTAFVKGVEYVGCYKDNALRTMLWEGILGHDPYPCACSCKLRYGEAFTGIIGLQGGRCYCEGEAGGRGRLAKDKYDQIGKENEQKCGRVKVGRETSIEEVRIGGQWTNAVYRVVLGPQECDAMGCAAKSQQKMTAIDVATEWNGWEDCAPMPGYECVVPPGSRIRIGARRPIAGDIVVDAESSTMTCSRGKMLDLVLPRLFGRLPSVSDLIDYMCDHSEWVRIRTVSCWYQDRASAAANDNAPRSRDGSKVVSEAPAHSSPTCIAEQHASTIALDECVRTGDWKSFVESLVGPGFGTTIIEEMKMCRNVARLAECLPSMQPYYLPPHEERHTYAGVDHTLAELGSVPATAIIVPFRGRPHELDKFIYWLIPTLMRQNIMFKIYVVEELAFKMWNKAQMLNIGVIEAMKEYDWECFVFHDIDILLESNAETCRYVCEDTNIVHYSTWLRGYKRAYSEGLVDLTPVHGGGVAAASYQQLVKVNGWSNLFWGWGSEDNEFGQRALLTFGAYPTEWGDAKLHGKSCPFIHMHDDEEGISGSHSNIENNDACVKQTTRIEARLQLRPACRSVRPLPSSSLTHPSSSFSPPPPPPPFSLSLSPSQTRVATIGAHGD